MNAKERAKRIVDAFYDKEKRKAIGKDNERPNLERMIRLEIEGALQEQ